MVKLFALLRRREGMSTEEFVEHWRDRHGPLIAGEPSLARHILRYEQHPRHRPDALVRHRGGRRGRRPVVLVDRRLRRVHVRAGLCGADRPGRAAVPGHGPARVHRDRGADRRDRRGLRPVSPTAHGVSQLEGGGARSGGAVVTGGASGIGAAVVRRLASDGVRVGVLDRNSEAATAASPRRSAGSHLIADVADSAALDAALARAAAELGVSGWLVNNAGVGNLKATRGLHRPRGRPDLAGQRLGDVPRAARGGPADARHGGGAIVNVASVSGVRPTRGEAPYSAAKAAVVALTQGAALELAPSIRVNCVSPGIRADAAQRAARGRRRRSCGDRGGHPAGTGGGTRGGRRRGRVPAVGRSVVPHRTEPGARRGIDARPPPRWTRSWDRCCRCEADRRAGVGPSWQTRRAM